MLVDHSAVTGESTPTEAGAGDKLFTGGLIRRGEATAVVTATGSRTYFGKTAELVREAKAAGHLQQMIFTVVKYLVAFDLVLAALVFAYALTAGMGAADILPFCLMLLVASIPVALPATFTLASALGTQELAHRGVLVSRLSAIEEAAAMDTLATDKTGTLTKNELTVAAVTALAPYSEADVIRFGALASDDATQDPIDLAILAAARSRGMSTAGLCGSEVRSLRAVHQVFGSPGAHGARDRAHREGSAGHDRSSCRVAGLSGSRQARRARDIACSQSRLVQNSSSPLPALSRCSTRRETDSARWSRICTTSASGF